MTEGAQELKTVALFLKRVVVRRCTHKNHPARVDFVPLPLAPGLNEFSLDFDRASGPEFEDTAFVFRQLGRRDRL